MQAAGYRDYTPSLEHGQSHGPGEAPETNLPTQESMVLVLGSVYMRGIWCPCGLLAGSHHQGDQSLPSSHFLWWWALPPEMLSSTVTFTVWAGYKGAAPCLEKRLW